MTTSLNKLFDKAIIASTKCIANTNRYESLMYQGCRDFKALNNLKKDIEFNKGIAYMTLCRIAEMLEIKITHESHDFYTTERMIQELCNKWDKFNCELKH